MVEKKRMFIAGKWKDADTYYDLYSPYNQEKIAEIPIANEDVIEEAIFSAHTNSNVIAKIPAHKRAAILENAVNIIRERQEEIAKTISIENAKPLKASRMEVERTIQTYKFAAEEAKRLYGETIPMDAAKGAENKFGYTKREPIGVIAAITPFNFPLNLVAHKLGPAIAAGNSIVLKPASQTPLSSLLIAEVFEEAGLPPGVLNVITGKGSVIGDILVKDKRVNMVTFTGSLEVGLNIKEKSRLKRVTLELGSNSPVIIDEVENLQNVAKKCVTGAFSYAGQICISIQRIYVHEKVFNKFIKEFINETQKLIVGDPLKEETDVSSMINMSETKRINEWINDAKKLGGKVVHGGTNNGTLMEPTIVTNLPQNAKLCQKEAFAPIVIINPFKKLDEAIENVNHSDYGLQAGIFTETINNAFYAVENIKAGGVIINDIPTFRVDHMPYGGVKDSGIGKEGIKYSIEEMTELKFVAFQMGI